MTVVERSIAVGVLSSSVGLTPNEQGYSYVFDEANHLAARGVKVHIIRAKVGQSSISSGISFHDLQRKISITPLLSAARNITLFPRSTLSRGYRKIYRESRYALHAIRTVKANRLDLVHAQFAYPEGLVGFICKKRTKKPLIVTLHGYDILVEPSIDYGIRLDQRLDKLVQCVLNKADAVVSASKAVYDEAKSIMKGEDRLKLIPNGVDINAFTPDLDRILLRRKLGVPDNAVVVSSLRAHEPVYGLEYLIRSIPFVLSERRNPIFVVGGEGSLRKKHEQLARDLGILDYVRFPGVIPRAEVPSYHAMTDLAVAPSLQEGFGLAATEAMACGRPVIASNVGGLRDQIEDGFNGFLFPPRDPDAIAKRILNLIDDRTLREKLGLNGRKLVEQKFNLDTRIMRIKELYKETLDQS